MDGIGTPLDRAEGVRFTPGPWEAVDHLDSENDPGFTILAVHPDIPKGGTPTRGMVAWIGLVGASFENPDRASANAHLLTASPTLYTACSEAFDFLGDVDGASEIRGKLLRALSLARGDV